MLREQILYEGPTKIAAIILESVTGTNGVLKPPAGVLACQSLACLHLWGGGQRVRFR